MKKELLGKVAWVTGSSRGIGRAIAIALARKGADICVHCRENWNLADEVRQQIKDMNQRSIVVSSDIAIPAKVQQNVELIESEFGRLDILINNAAYVSSHRLPGADIAAIHKIIDINLKGPFNCIYSSLGLLQQSRGVIVNIGSLNSRAISAAGPAYAATKAGLVAMTANLAVDLGQLGIRINTVAPPLTDTDMGKWAQKEAGTEKAGISSLQRVAKPDEVAEVVAYFCLPTSNYISGETLYMGGGYLI